jgi:hypothetical protein
MLCSGCAANRPPHRPREVIVQVRRSGFRSLLPPLCPSCGLPMDSDGLQKHLSAKIRQLEQFGFLGRIAGERRTGSG